MVVTIVIIIIIRMLILMITIVIMIVIVVIITMIIVIVVILILILIIIVIIMISSSLRLKLVSKVRLKPPIEADMSLVPMDMMSEMESEKVVSMSISVLTVVATIMLLRGVLGFMRDSVRVVTGVMKLMSKTYEDKETQTEEYQVRLPEIISFNPKAEVYHVPGCHHVGLKAIEKTACTPCQNRW